MGTVKFESQRPIEPYELRDPVEYLFYNSSIKQDKVSVKRRQ